MDDKIIKAAKEAGGTTYTNRHHDGTACAFGPEALERFYAIVRAEALEDAAALFDQPHAEYFGRESADAIRALKDQT